jgi:hypothetical protein
VLHVPPSNIDGFLSRDTYVSSTQLNRPSWNKMCDSSLLDPDRLEVFLSKNFNSHKDTRCYMIRLLTEMLFFQEVHVFLQLSLTVLFGTKCAFLHFENPEGQAVFLSKTNSILTGKKSGTFSCF